MSFLLAADLSWVWTAVGLMCVPLLVILNALFVAAEFSLVALRATQVEEMVRQQTPGALSVKEAIDHLDRSIAATQLGITLASIALGWIGEPALAQLIDPMFSFVGEIWKPAAVHTVATAVAFALITFMHVVFGELIPKTVALQRPDATSLWVARPLMMFTTLTRPFVVSMNGVGNMILKWWGFETASSGEMAHSVQELHLLIESSRGQGVLGSTQAEVALQAFKLSHKTVAECMVPRDEMSALELRTPPEKVLEAVRETAHTRLPIYDGKLDDIVGIVNTKDLFHLFSLRGVVVLDDAMYPPLFLKPDKDIASALQLFRRVKRPMAVVRDEAGKVVGLITLEDVLEQIVGDIEDEHDV
jgi:CBS domain containing-hemolysin-like protein